MFNRPIYKNPNLPSSPPLRFPQKLWKIANECQSGAVCWSPDGKSILLRYSLFRNEFMSSKKDLFKTDNISSFVRQLNLYGFRKVYDHAHKQAYKANIDLHEFSNSYFQRDRPDLLDKVTRKSGILKERNDLWTENHKSMDYSDECSCDKLEDTNTSDHSYISNQMHLSVKETPLPIKREEKVSQIDQYLDDQENAPYNIPKVVREIPDPLPLAANLPEQNALVLPVKKKRGRKPGSKRRQMMKTQYFNNAYRKTISFCPTLKNPEQFPDIVFFNDDDERIFLRHTSRDVMLSSTLPFQETPEYLELKDTYDRLYNPDRNKGLYGSLTFSQGKFLYK